MCRSNRSKLISLAFAAFFTFSMATPAAQDTTTEATVKPETSQIIATFPRYFPPYFQLDADGKPDGFAVDVLNAVAARAGLRVTYRPLASWSDVAAALRSGEADVIPSMGISTERAARMLFTSPVDTASVLGFVRRGFDELESTGEIAGRTVGVVETNVALPLLSQRTDITLNSYNSLNDALIALLADRIDVLFYPEHPVWNIAEDGGFRNRIRAIGPPLELVERAIAVRNDLPGIRSVLDRELKAFKNTAVFEKIYRKWYVPIPDRTPRWPVYLVISFAIAAIGVIALIAYLLHQRGLLHFNLASVFNDKSSAFIFYRFALLLALMATVTMIVVSTAIWILYTAAFEEERSRLQDMARSQARLIESVARFDQLYSSDFPGGKIEATVSQIKDGFGSLSGSTEIALARRKGDQIEYILRQFASRRYEPTLVPIESRRSEAMRRALFGNSGTIIGLDYRGESVLAAHEPVAIVDLGIVAKKDISQIRQPFFHAIAFATLISIVVIGMGAVGFFVLSSPIISRTLKNERRLRDASTNIVHAISATIEKRDPYTSGHQERVAELAVAVAHELGWDDFKIEGIRLGGLVHDIGKIYVPSEILNRPGKLTEAEFAVIKSHPEVGFDILKDMELPWPIADIIIQHHERLDGTGYPHGLTGDQIIPEAKIIAVCDVIEAMASHRPYRAALGIETGIGELLRGKGTIYDPTIVDCCVELIQNKNFKWKD